MHPKRKDQNKTFNCTKEACPVQGQCLLTNRIYSAKVTERNNQEKVGSTMQYIGQSVPEFKGRYKNYKSDFRIEARRNSTELRKYIWLIKERGKNWEINWSREGQMQHLPSRKTKYNEDTKVNSNQ